MKNVFDVNETKEIIDRINKLTPETPGLWGKMSVGQMLSHCNVTYELVYDDKHPKPGSFKKFILKMLIKNLIVNETPYKKNGRTAPEFIITDKKVFEPEKTRLINYITKTQELGGDHFNGKDSSSFGPLKTVEWNNMFYKHLDHHLCQFGV